MLKTIVTMGHDAGEALLGWQKWLELEPVVNNLSLSLLSDRKQTRAPVNIWSAMEVDGDRMHLSGLAVQTSPGHLVNLSGMTALTARALAEALPLDAAVVGVSGPREAAKAYADAVARPAGLKVAEGLAVKVRTCRVLNTPHPVPGRLRTATLQDRDRVIAMMRGFYADIGEAADPSALVDQRLPDARYRFWLVEDEPVALVGHSAPLAGVARVQVVSTSRSWRRGGFGAAAVAALTADLLALGVQPILFAESADEAVNRFYDRLGYHTVALRQDYLLQEA